jgi:hypothetical protein
MARNFSIKIVIFVVCFVALCAVGAKIIFSDNTQSQNTDINYATDTTASKSVEKESEIIPTKPLEETPLNNAKAIVVFMFDDGYSEDALTYSIFKSYGYVCNFGLITDKLNAKNRNPVENYIGYQKEGFEILSHASGHLDMRKSAKEFIKEEIEYEYKASLDKLIGLGFNINGLVVPYGSTRYMDEIKENYDYILTYGSGLNNKTNFESKTLSRISEYSSGVDKSKELIDETIKNEDLLIFYDHRIGNEGALSESELRRLLDYTKTKVDENLIQVCTMKDAINKYYGTNIN